MPCLHNPRWRTTSFHDGPRVGRGAHPSPVRAWHGKCINHFPLQLFGQKLVIRPFLAAREDAKFHFYLGDQAFTCETEGKSDIRGQLLSPGMLPPRSLESAAGRKSHGQIPTFHPRMAQTPVRIETHRRGGLGTKVKRELWSLPRRIVTGLTSTRECRDEQGSRRWRGIQGYRTELESCPTA